MISSFKSLRSRRRPTGHNDLDPINRGSLTMVTPHWKHNVNEPQVLPWSLSHCMTRPGPPTRGNARETSLQILGIGLTVPQILNRSRVRERIRKDGEGLAVILDHFSIQKAGERKSRSKSRFQTTIYKEQDSLDDGMVYTLRSSLEPSSLFKSSTAAKINLSARRSRRMMMMMMVEVTMKRGTGEKPTQTKRGKETGPPSEKTSCKPLLTDHAEGGGALLSWNLLIGPVGFPLHLRASAFCAFRTRGPSQSGSTGDPNSHVLNPTLRVKVVRKVKVP